MTTLHWDHVVHYVNDLQKPIKMFRDNGLFAFKGGSHTNWGTYNALSYFGLTYVEFLAVEHRDVAIRLEGPNVLVKDTVKLLPNNEALRRIAIRTDNIDETVGRLTANGIEPSPVMAGKRLDSRGKLIEWKMVTIDGDFHGLVYPFFIQWKESDEERLKNLAETGVIQNHPAGDVSIESAVFTVSNPEAAAMHWQQLFNLPMVGSSSLAIGGKQFIFTKGDTNQLTQIHFKTTSKKLDGTTLAIGEGNYVFRKNV
ncbi:VOC family protein [Neobacillus dielmonensis]|uniref:VOC family protein n=1 Tax=Neobacillus dielmonensis TaxID=1347369 RepID=UPI0005AB86D0|nr:VOC family protein [Neobacillus dielmonensis]